MIPPHVCVKPTFVIVYLWFFIMLRSLSLVLTASALLSSTAYASSVRPFAQAGFGLSDTSVAHPGRPSSDTHKKAFGNVNGNLRPNARAMVGTRFSAGRFFISPYGEVRVNGRESFATPLLANGKVVHKTQPMTIPAGALNLPVQGASNGQPTGQPLANQLIPGANVTITFPSQDDAARRPQHAILAIPAGELQMQNGVATNPAALQVDAVYPGLIQVTATPGRYTLGFGAHIGYEFGPFQPYVRVGMTSQKMTYAIYEDDTLYESRKAMNSLCWGVGATYDLTPNLSLDMALLTSNKVQKATALQHKSGVVAPEKVETAPFRRVTTDFSVGLRYTFGA